MLKALILTKWLKDFIMLTSNLLLYATREVCLHLYFILCK